ncbi:MAG TPA: sigma-70 family RNA polymerase sigma factor [Candidatus Acidoferrales bacterium]
MPQLPRNKPKQVSLFPGPSRITDMMLGAAIFGGSNGNSGTAYWEAGVGVESEIAQLRRGDLDALSSLLTRYQNRLYRYLLRMVRQPAEAEDLFQQTWLRVAEKIHSYDQRRNFEAWLFTLARNLAIDHLRRVRPESLDEPIGGEAFGGSGETAAARLVSHETPALDRVLARERSNRLADAMELLPVIQREVLTLRFEEEMKLEEIAEILGAPLSTVKTRLRRGLEHLRGNLESRFPGESWQ